ncbi:hypothetical protein J5Y09_04395, partial [Roseomonas sp. PWR1]
VPVGDANFRVTAPIATREVRAIARLTDGSLALILADARWLTIREAPPALVAHLKAAGASAG